MEEQLRWTHDAQGQLGSLAIISSGEAIEGLDRECRLLRQRYQSMRRFAGVLLGLLLVAILAAWAGWAQ